MQSLTGQKGRSILVVEDSDEDYAAFLRAFAKIPDTPPIHRSKDGDDTLDYLFHTGPYAESKPPRPSLILLDLNLPGTDGREVLEKLEVTPELKAVPLIVLTSSAEKKDVELSYRSGANSYITKTHNWARFEETVKILMNYWFNAVVLP